MIKKVLSGFGLALITAAILLTAYALYNGRDRHPDYSLNLSIKAPQTANYKAGFSKVKITPIVSEKWVDNNQNAQFDKGVDLYDDRNKNRKIDAVWMAGFQNKRAANGVHDDLWARAMVIDDGQTRMAIVALDLIGFSHKNVINVRQKLPKNLGVTYSIICSTHNHEGPDMIGMWGENFLKSGVDEVYERNVENKVVEAISIAVKNIQPAKLSIAQDLDGAKELTTDTRLPIVKDDGLYILHAKTTETDSTLGTLVVWGNHPETLWSKNLSLTSDFPHYVREGIEKGIYNQGKEIQKGLGGTVVYATGCVGGLMTTSPKVKIKDLFSEKYYEEPSFEKAQAEGYTLASLVLKALQNEEPISQGIDLKAQTFEIPLENVLFKLGVALSVIDAGYSSWGKLRTEAAVWTMGDASFMTVPGEIYPEIIHGGIETPKEADLKIKQPIEVPPLKSLMKGKFKCVIGLANDEIGYIIPKSEWDVEAPYLYGAKEQFYGEINSVGPQTAPMIHKVLKNMLERK